MGFYGTMGHPTSVLRMDICKRIVKCLFSFTELFFLMQKSGPSDIDPLPFSLLEVQSRMHRIKIGFGAF